MLYFSCLDVGDLQALRDTTQEKAAVVFRFGKDFKEEKEEDRGQKLPGKKQGALKNKA